MSDDLFGELVDADLEAMNKHQQRDEEEQVGGKSDEENVDEPILVSVFSRLNQGKEGPVYVLRHLTKLKRRWEMPCKDVPSSCFKIGYELAEDPDFGVRIIRAFPLPIRRKDLLKPARELNLLKGDKALAAWFSGTSADTTVSSLSMIPARAMPLRALTAPALQDNDEFYQALLYYPDTILLKLNRDQIRQLVDMAGCSVIYYWPALRRILALHGKIDQIPICPGLTALTLKYADEDIQRAVGAAKELVKIHVETGATIFSGIPSDIVDIFMSWEFMVRINPPINVNDTVHDTTHDEEPQEELCMWTEVGLLEEILDAKLVSKVKTFDFHSWWSDFYFHASQQAADNDLVFVAADEQTRRDAEENGLTEVHPIDAALAGQLGNRLLVLRAERLTTDKIIALANAGTGALYLFGDARQVYAFEERDTYFFGFAHLCARNAQLYPEHHSVHHYSPDTKQSKWFDAIVTGNAHDVSVSHAFSDWNQLPRLLRIEGVFQTTVFKDVLILCNNEEERQSAMNALTHPGSRILDDDVPSPGLEYLLPKEGFSGKLMRIDENTRKIEFEHGSSFRLQPVKVAAISLYTQFLGTRYKHVVCLVNETTPRSFLAAAVKFSTETFRIFFIPGCTTQHFHQLLEFPCFRRSTAVL